MKSLSLVDTDDPVLHRKNQTVNSLPNDDVRALVPALIDAMHRFNGIGIAAPQVGRDLQVIVVDRRGAPLVLVNPEITRRSFRTAKAEEGCLSAPGTFGVVKRAKTIWVRGRTVDGAESNFKAQGLFARVLQHEIDHINGTLFLDRAERITKQPDS